MYLVLTATYLWDLYRNRYSLVGSPLGLLEAGAQCAPYKCTFQTSSNGPAIHPIKTESEQRGL